MTQWEYDTWYNNIPENTDFIVQGNNHYEEQDHVRACKDLDEFKEISRIKNCLHSDILEYEGPWDDINNEPTILQRYMAIGFKTQYDRED
jgi:hypothetical protein